MKQQTAERENELKQAQENESIQELIKKLELYYDTTIEIQRPSLLKHHYSRLI